MQEHEDDIAEELEIRPEQREGYLALSGKIKTHLRNRTKGWFDNIPELKTQFDSKALDTARISEILKEQVRTRPSNEELEMLIDETVAFYQTLDPEQQETIRKKFARHLNWF